MKNILLLSLLLISFNCIAQNYVAESISDLYLLEKNKEKFIGRPLSCLLDNIKPKIFYVIPRAQAMPYASFRFGFTPYTQKDSLLSNGEKAPILRVLFEDGFEWNTQQRYKEGSLMRWGDDEYKTYGNLTVAGIQVTE